MSGVVVDASVAIKWVLSEPYQMEALSLIALWKRQSMMLVVPSWFACEVANVLYQRLRGGALSLTSAQLVLDTILNTVVVQDFEPETALRALELAHVLGQRASYDTQYLALAEHYGCELWTADERFWSAARIAFPRIHWIGEISDKIR